MGASAQTTQNSDPYADGEHALERQQFRAAAEAFSRAVAADALRSSPLHPDAGLRAAKASFEAGDYARTEAALRTYLKTSPTSAEATYLLAFTQQRQNHPRESLETYNVATRLAPPSPEDLRRVSLNYVILDDYPDALHWLQRATGADPRNAEAWYDLARVQMHDGRFEQAISSLQKSLAIRPRDARALGNLGKCLENQNRVDEALASYSAAVEAARLTSRQVEEPFLDYGALLNTRSRFVEALPLLRRATELAATDAHAFEEMARSQLGLGDVAGAQESLERAVALDPQNSRLHFQLARVFRSQGLQDRARQEFDRSAALYGTSSHE